MRKLLLKVKDQVCDECALALRRFIGNMDGVESIAVEEKKIAVVFDDAKIPEEEMIKLTGDSLDKLGHKLTEHWHLV
jgi:copper chaperone CopZ